MQRLRRPALKGHEEEKSHAIGECLWRSFLLAGAVAPPLETRNSAIIESPFGSAVFLLLNTSKRSI